MNCKHCNASFAQIYNGIHYEVRCRSVTCLVCNKVVINDEVTHGRKL